MPLLNVKKSMLILPPPPHLKIMAHLGWHHILDYCEALRWYDIFTQTQTGIAYRLRGNQESRGRKMQCTFEMLWNQNRPRFPKKYHDFLLLGMLSLDLVICKARNWNSNFHRLVNGEAIVSLNWAGVWKLSGAPRVGRRASWKHTWYLLREPRVYPCKFFWPV